MGGIGRGKGRGRLLRAEERLSPEMRQEEKTKQKEEEEDRPILYKMGRVGCIGRGINKNFEGKMVEICRRVQDELFDRNYYLNYYRSGCSEDTQAKLISKKLEEEAKKALRPRKKKKGKRKDRTGKSSASQPKPLPNKPVPIKELQPDYDSEVEEYEAHLRWIKQEERKRERRRQEQMRMFRDGGLWAETESEHEEDSGDEGMERRLKAKEKLLGRLRKQRKGEARKDGKEEGKGEKIEDKKIKMGKGKDVKKKKTERVVWEYV